MRIIPRAAALVLSALTLVPIASAQNAPSGPEKILFDSANRERRTIGVPPLHWDDALAVAARRHAQTMSQHNAISHQFPGEIDFSRRASEAGAHFSAAAENVAVGPDAEEIHDAWMESPGHRRNLLDPDMNSLGVAVVMRDGQLFAVEDFDRTLTALPLQEQEKRVAAQLRAMEVKLLQDRDDARRACSQGSNYHASREPQYVLHYSTTNLDDLPAQLQQKIRSEQYHRAVVGACPPQNEQGFTNYQVAVILYK